MIAKVWEIYENLNEIVYVTNVASNELVYMNKKAREYFGFSANAELVGQKCYKVLQGSNAPCAMCTNGKIKPGEFYEWTYYNPVVQRTFALKDTLVLLNDTCYRIEIAIDITRQEAQKHTLEILERNDTLINEGLKIALAEETAEGSINILLEYFGKALQGERCYIFECKDNQYCSNTYEWCANEIEPQKHNLQAVNFACLSSWFTMFNEDKPVLIEDLEKTRHENEELYQILKAQNISSLVASPLISKGKVIGFYGIDNPPLEIMKHISVTLGVLSTFLVSILNRRDLVRKLERLSYFDQLTGAGNRHAMRKIIDEANAESSVGILYCDVMGLKKVNDKKGHEAGDSLILSAYKLLAQFFADYAIFRIGGDEFCVICLDISVEAMQEKLRSLRQAVESSVTKMAIGCLWEAKNNGNIEQLISDADKLMYEDKRNYYAEKAEFDRRVRENSTPKNFCVLR